MTEQYTWPRSNREETRDTGFMAEKMEKSAVAKMTKSVEQ